jgi:hypothetical protein
VYFIVTELLQQSIGNLGQTESFLVLYDQRNNRNSIKNNGSHLKLVISDVTTKGTAKLKKNSLTWFGLGFISFLAEDNPGDGG